MDWQSNQHVHHLQIYQIDSTMTDKNPEQRLFRGSQIFVRISFTISVLGNLFKSYLCIMLPILLPLRSWKALPDGSILQEDRKVPQSTHLDFNAPRYLSRNCIINKSWQFWNTTKQEKCSYLSWFRLIDLVWKVIHFYLSVTTAWFNISRFRKFIVSHASGLATGVVVQQKGADL